MRRDDHHFVGTGLDGLSPVFRFRLEQQRNGDKRRQRKKCHKQLTIHKSCLRQQNDVFRSHRDFDGTAFLTAGRPQFAERQEQIVSNDIPQTDFT